MNELPPRFNTRELVNNPVSLGIVACSILLDKSNTSDFVNVPIVILIVPPI